MKNTSMNSSRSSTTVEIKVWDPLVRVFHWSLVTLFAVAKLTGDEESRLHELSGYGIIGLVVLRVFWGFVGTRYARFSNFVYRPSGILAYAKDLLISKPKRYLGHNPLGGAMVIVLMAALLATGLTGLALQNSDGEVSGLASVVTPALISPAMADDDDENESNEAAGEAWEDLHEFFANLTLLLAALHIGGVIVSSLVHRESLVRAMITGRKTSDVHAP